jgi:adenosine deaminase
MKNFQEFLTNLFQPLFEATIDPSSHPDLYRFMHHLTGFDSVDDETKPEKPILTADMPHPEEWNNKENPPYVYYLVSIIRRRRFSFVLIFFVLVLHVRKHSDLESVAHVSKFTTMRTSVHGFVVLGLVV